MPSVGDLVVNLKANHSQFNRGLKNAERRVASFAKGAAAALGVGLVGGFTAATVAAVKFAAEAETLSTQFKVLTGSAERAKEMVEDLTTFAAATPFSKSDLSDAAKTLLAFKFTGDSVLPTLKQLGDVAAASGSQIGDLARILGRATATGKVQGELLNQLIERGVPVLDALSRATGFAAKDIQKLASQGKITGQDLQRAFQLMTSAGGMFEGGMKQLSKTTAGQFSTMKDNAVQLAEVLGKDLLPVVNDLLQSSTGFFQGFSKGFKALRGAQGDDALYKPTSKEFARQLALDEGKRRPAGQRPERPWEKLRKQRDAELERRRTAYDEDVRRRRQERLGQQGKALALPIKNAFENAISSIKSKAGTAASVFGDLKEKAAGATGLRDQQLSFRISEAQRAINKTQPKNLSPFASVAQRGSGGVLESIMHSRGGGSDPAQQERKKQTELLERLLEEQRRNTAEALGIELQEAV